MKLHKITIALTASFFAVSAMAGIGGGNQGDAGHGTVTFTGSVIDAACSIKSGSIDQSVDLGAISKAQLTNGGKSNPVDFSIGLQNCDLSTAANATVTFNGTAGDAANGLDKAFMVTGQASGGVGVVITDNTGGKIIEPGQTSDEFTLNAGANDLEFKAYVQGASSSAIVAGDFKSVANFVMEYK